MATHYAIFAGNGITSRANVEALLEDYLYVHKKDDVKFVLVFNKKASQGQMFVAQLAHDKSIDIIVICKEGASFETLPAASVSYSETPFDTAAEFGGFAFVLPNVDDPEHMKNIMLAFSKANVPMLDLTEGLYPLEPITDTLDEDADALKTASEAV